MNFGAAKILCVEPYLAVLESRCAILKYSGYDAVSASPQLVEIVLRSQNFDLLVLSNLSKLTRWRKNILSSQKDSSPSRHAGCDENRAALRTKSSRCLICGPRKPALASSVPGRSWQKTPKRQMSTSIR
jgi:uncharacterized protein with PIN domain